MKLLSREELESLMMGVPREGGTVFVIKQEEIPGNTGSAALIRQ